MTTTCKAETELYPPVTAYLTAQGFTVRAEVKGCDVVGVRGEEVVVVELKLTLNLTLLAQAVRRLSITPSVYVAIPRPANKGKWLRAQRDQLRVLRRLGLGLLLVSSAPGVPAVDIIAHPEAIPPRQRYPKKRAILQEVARRSGDYNTGGSCRRKLITAYRENAIHAACIMQTLGPQTPRALRARGTGEKTLAMLRRNVYGWFERLDRGIYGITPRGLEELPGYAELVKRYQPVAPDGKMDAQSWEGEAPAEP